jgi:hypothetical protein
MKKFQADTLDLCPPYSLEGLSTKLGLSHNWPFQRPSYVCLCSWSSCLPALSCLIFHMPSRTTRRCKETLLQVKQRLVREQKNRKRIRELLDDRVSESDSDSEAEQTSSVAVNTDSLSAIRRDLYLGLLSFCFCCCCIPIGFAVPVVEFV